MEKPPQRNSRLTLLCLHACQANPEASGVQGVSWVAPALRALQAWPCDALLLYGEGRDALAALTHTAHPLPVYRISGQENVRDEISEVLREKNLPYALLAIDNALPAELRQLWHAWSKEDPEVQCLHLPTESPWSNRVEEPRPADAMVREASSTWSVPRVAPAAGRKVKPNPHTVQEQLGIIAHSPAMQQVLQEAAVVAEHGVPVLITGETGTGKERLARFIHLLSGREVDRFVPVNCAALPESLAESVLFGHRKGAFTGAHQDQQGKFVQADEGSLFLDELGELPLELQPKLLRVLEDQLVEPIGANQSQQVNTRLIAATHQDLLQGVKEGQFREDLYYRLTFATLHIPALRERPEDISAISLRHLQQLNRMLETPKTLSSESMDRLVAHPWPGNVRDLQNVIGRSALWCPETVIEPEHLKFDILLRSSSEIPEPTQGFDMEDYLSNQRTALIQRALEKSGGNQSQAAALLGISPQAVNKFVKNVNNH